MIDEDIIEKTFNSNEWFLKDGEEINKVNSEGLYISLKDIGNGEIIEKDYYDYRGDRLIYKEFFKNDTLILVVHGAFMRRDGQYRYEIGIYRNNGVAQQYGGGYGTGGNIVIEHTRLLHSISFTTNKMVISATCIDVKNYAEGNY